MSEKDRREFMKTTLMCGAAAACSAALGTAAAAVDKPPETQGEIPKPIIKITVLNTPV